MKAVDLRLYGLVDPARSRLADLAEAARRAVGGGATLIQYRDKTAETRPFVERARAIRAALEGSGVPLLINDRVDVALAAGADGVHLGQKDMTVEDARRLLGPDAIVGLTIKSELHADEAPYPLLDYVCIGGVFATASKDNPDPPVGLDGLERLVRRTREHSMTIPTGAIAGIDAGNAASVIGRGADGVAVISEVFMADDIAAAARGLRDIVDGALAARAGEAGR